MNSTVNNNAAHKPDVTPATDERHIRLQDRMEYHFSDPDLLGVALTHASYGDGRRRQADNERLEFLGDRILGLLTAEFLYNAGVDKEGRMARRLNALVRKETCAAVATDIGLGDALRMSRSEQKQGGRRRISILGDACEALLGAIYLDGGIEAARTFYAKHWQSYCEHIMTKTAKDAKTELQEMAAMHQYGNPDYKVLSRSGPDHRPHFVVTVSVKGLGASQGEGASKKEAERMAAKTLLNSRPS